MKFRYLMLGLCFATCSAQAQDKIETQELQPDTINKTLNDVTIEADRIVSTPEKTMIFVSKSIKKTLSTAI